MNPHDSFAQTHVDDLSWQASLYVLGELTPDEIVDFEERLLTDQAVREAVAQAAKMTEGLWLASAMESMTTTEPPAQAAQHAHKERSLSRRLIWLASTAVAAVLAFCVGWWFANPEATPPAGPIAHSPADDSKPDETGFVHEIEGAGELIELWTASESLLAELHFGPKAEYPAEFSEELAMRDNSEQEDDQFAWMLIALSADSDQPAGPVMEN